MRHNTLLTGANGMLGKEISNVIDGCYLLRGKKDLNLLDLNKVEAFLKKNSFSTIIHSAAITNLQECQKSPANCMVLHSEITKLFNKYCDKLIYISTVPVWEKKDKSFQNIYFDSKQAGEAIVNQKKNNLIVRTNIVGTGGLTMWAINTLNNKTKIDGYKNSYFNPVHTRQVANFIKQSINKGIHGVREVFGDTVLSKYDFITEVAKKKGFDTSLVHEKYLQKDQNLVHLTQTNQQSFIECMELI